MSKLPRLSAQQRSALDTLYTSLMASPGEPSLPRSRFSTRTVNRLLKRGDLVADGPERVALADHIIEALGALNGSAPAPTPAASPLAYSAPVPTPEPQPEPEPAPMPPAAPCGDDPEDPILSAFELDVLPDSDGREEYLEGARAAVRAIAALEAGIRFAGLLQRLDVMIDGEPEPTPLDAPCPKCKADIGAACRDFDFSAMALADIATPHPEREAPTAPTAPATYIDRETLATVIEKPATAPATPPTPPTPRLITPGGADASGLPEITPAPAAPAVDGWGLEPTPAPAAKPAVDTSTPAGFLARLTAAPATATATNPATGNAIVFKIRDNDKEPGVSWFLNCKPVGAPKCAYMGMMKREDSEYRDRKSMPFDAPDADLAAYNARRRAESEAGAVVAFITRKGEENGFSGGVEIRLFKNLLANLQAGAFPSTVRWAVA